MPRTVACSPCFRATKKVTGVGLQVVALHFGALALVQPLLVSGLLFALLLRHLGSWSITRQEVGWAVLLSGCLIGFLVLSGAVTASQSAHADRSAAVIAAIAASVAVLICLVVAQRQVPPAGRAALIGAAVGAIYATTAALIKSATGLLAERGLHALLGSWQLYTALMVAASGLFLAQVAFQAGPLTASLPAISTIDPLLSVLIGGARLRRAPAPRSRFRRPAARPDDPARHRRHRRHRTGPGRDDQ